MTLCLILIRHAKSDWDDPDAEDHARVLNARGRLSAEAIGRWLEDRGESPGAILCSDAARTMETATRVFGDGAAEVTPVASLYLASQDSILKSLRAARAPAVAVIGHNPGIGGFASAIVAEPPAHPRFAEYPTGATLIVEFDGDDWRKVAPGRGRVVAFTVPRDLI